MAVVVVRLVPRICDGPAVHVGKATTVPTLVPVALKVPEVPIEPGKLELMWNWAATVQTGVPVGVQLVVL
jgi:hypothetical protein